MEYNKEYKITFVSKDGSDEYDVKVIKKRTEQTEHLEVQDQKIKQKPGFPRRIIRACVDIINECYGYIPIIAYTTVFSILRFIYGNQKIIALYFILISVLLLLNDKIGKNDSNKRNTGLVVSLVIVIILLLIVAKNERLLIWVDEMNDCFECIINAIGIVISIYEANCQRKSNRKT